MEHVKLELGPNSLKKLVVGESTYQSAFDFNLSEGDFTKAREQLKETDEIRTASLLKLKELLSKDDKIRYRTDDAYLLRFLRFRKFDVQKTYDALRKFYKTRNEYPEIFCMPENAEMMLNMKFLNLMPYTNEDGNIILIHKFANWNPDSMSMHDLLKMSFMNDIITLNPRIQINGVIDVLDFAGTNLNHFSHILKPSTVLLTSKIMQELYPVRVQRLVLLNCNSLLYGALTSLRFFMKQKIKDRIVLLQSDLNQLHKYINPALLPKEYGGSLDDDECYSYIFDPILRNKNYLTFENSFISAKE